MITNIKRVTFCLRHSVVWTTSSFILAASLYGETRNLTMPRRTVGQLTQQQWRLHVYSNTFSPVTPVEALRVQCTIGHTRHQCINVHCLNAAWQSGACRKSKISEFLGTLFSRRDMQRLFVVRVKVAWISWAFRLRQERSFDLSQCHIIVIVLPSGGLKYIKWTNYGSISSALIGNNVTVVPETSLLGLHCLKGYKAGTTQP